MKDESQLERAVAVLEAVAEALDGGSLVKSSVLIGAGKGGSNMTYRAACRQSAKELRAIAAEAKAKVQP